MFLFSVWFFVFVLSVFAFVCFFLFPFSFLRSFFPFSFSLFPFQNSFPLSVLLFFHTSACMSAARALPSCCSASSRASCTLFRYLHTGHCMGCRTRRSASHKIGFRTIEILDLLATELLSVLKVQKHILDLLLLFQIVAVVRPLRILERLRHRRIHDCVVVGLVALFQIHSRNRGLLLALQLLVIHAQQIILILA